MAGNDKKLGSSAKILDSLNALLTQAKSSKTSKLSNQPSDPNTSSKKPVSMNELQELLNACITRKEGQKHIPK